MRERWLQQVHPPVISQPNPESGAEAEHNIAPDVGPADIVLESDAGYWKGQFPLPNGRTAPFLAYTVGRQVHIWVAGKSYIFAATSPTTRRRASEGSATDEIICPMPGVVLIVHVSEGDVVEHGQDLVIMESMKIEQVFKSPRDGVVQRVSVQVGDRVERGMRLVVLDPLPTE